MPSDSSSTDLLADEDADAASTNGIRGGRNSPDASGPGPGPFSILSKDSA